ncbi:MAG: STAS/SEC14 domain-containing protein [Actinobacteria bacterium]|nr:STAS/SEC14 domain-containing protein [Actinomycetota bacterium]
MIKRFEDMGAGAIGFELGGEVTREEYRSVLEPVLEDAVDLGEVRLLLQTAEDFDGMSIGARMEDAKANLKFGVAHRRGWRRVAIVTDVGWLAASYRIWAHFVPVEVRSFPMAEAAAARAWVAA